MMTMIKTINAASNLHGLFNIFFLFECLFKYDDDDDDYDDDDDEDYDDDDK